MNEKVVKHADKKASEGACKLIEEASGAWDLGDCMIAIGAEGAATYLGHCFRLTGTRYGDVAMVLGGDNCRIWGTTKGRLELAHGNPNRERHDPAPGLLVPWERVLMVVPITNGWKPRQTGINDVLKLIEKNFGKNSEAKAA